MAHASGNPTWQDYPSLDTMVSAAALENQENTLDRIATSLFGGPGRTAPYRATAAYGGTYLHPNADVWAATTGSWTALDDPDGLLYLAATGPGDTSKCRLQIPATGYWDITLHALASTNASTMFNGNIQTVPGTAAPVMGQTVAFDSRFANGAQNVAAMPHFYGKLTAATLVYWSTWASAASVATLSGTAFAARTSLIAVWCGT